MTSRIGLTTTDVVNKIDRRLGELQSEIVKLETARIALLDCVTSPGAAQPRPPRRQARRPSPRVATAEKITDLLASSNGMTTRELAHRTDGEQSEVLSLMRELEPADRVRRSGRRRSARWHLVTDEDRIAARVAELERAQG